MTLAKAQRWMRTAIGKAIVDAAIAVHRELGPGLLETVCEVVLLDAIWKLGYLLNFGEDMLKRGITRTVNGLPEWSSSLAILACLCRARQTGGLARER